MRGSRAAFPAAAGRWPLCEPESYTHWVTVSGDWAVDWTWRQFDPASAWPAVLPAELAAAAWLESAVWACDRCPELVGDPRHQDLAPLAMAAEHLAVARATAGTGPFPDPRHDDTPALVALCACAAHAASSVSGESADPGSAGVDGLVVRQRVVHVPPALRLPVPGAPAAAERRLEPDVVAAAVEGEDARADRARGRLEQRRVARVDGGGEAVGRRVGLGKASAADPTASIESTGAKSSRRRSGSSGASAVRRVGANRAAPAGPARRPAATTSAPAATARATSASTRARASAPISGPTSVAGSRGSPTRSAAKRAASRSVSARRPPRRRARGGSRCTSGPRARSRTRRCSRRRGRGRRRRARSPG